MPRIAQGLTLGHWGSLLAVAGLGCHSTSTSPKPAPTSLANSDTSEPKIASFSGPYRFLSNFWPATVEFEGLTYPSVEHAYQSAKTLNMEDRKRIAAIPDPGEAKKAGRALKYRADWDAVKLSVMESCVRYKFVHHPDLREKLLATGDACLEEGNTWDDQFWGVCNGQGENHLGKILMKVRAELKSKQEP